MPFILFFFLLIVLLIAVIEIGAIEYAYEKIGVKRRYAFVLLLLSLCGSYVNIPVAELPAEHVLSNQEIHYFGMHYVVPWVQEWPRTVVAINLGGAVIPILLSVYLLLKNRIIGPAALAVLVVTVVVHWMAEPVRGVGVAVPTFVPPIVATGAALLFAVRSARRGLHRGDTGRTDWGRYSEPGKYSGARRSHRFNWWRRHIRWNLHNGNYRGAFNRRAA
jgi:uncharacterized membrane protein